MKESTKTRTKPTKVKAAALHQFETRISSTIICMEMRLISFAQSNMSFAVNRSTGLSLRASQSDVKREMSIIATHTNIVNMPSEKSILYPFERGYLTSIIISHRVNLVKIYRSGGF